MKKAISLLFLFFMSFLAVAQNSSQQEIHFNHLFVKDGMPEGRVNVIAQDHQGYMWIGTQKGLVRYDGYSAKVYDFGIENPYDQDVLALYVDREGRLWVGGLSGGLYLYQRGEDRFIRYKIASSAADTASLFVIKMHEDKKGFLWLIYYDNSKMQNSLNRFDPATEKSVSYNQDEKGNHYLKAADFVQFSENDKGAIWVDSKNGIYHFDEKADHFETFLADNDSAKQQSLYSMVSSQGFLWFGAHKSAQPYSPEGLWRFDPKTGTVTVFSHHTSDGTSIADDDVHRTFIDSKDRLWVTTNIGLSLYDSKKNDFSNYSLTNNNTGKLIPLDEMKEDKNGNLWLSSRNAQGLVFFNTQTRTFTLYTAHEKEQYGLADNFVHSLFIDHSGTLWFGATQIGLQWINTQLSRFVQYKDQAGQPHHFPGGVVSSFDESRDGTIWLGTRHGLYHWEPRTDSFNLVKIKIGQENELDVAAVKVDQEGRVWFGVPFGSSPGLYSYDGRSGKTKYFSYHKEDTTSLCNNQVDRLFMDHLGNLWVGTYRGGICCYNRETQNFTRYPYVDDRDKSKSYGALDDRTVLSIYEDRNNTLWVGTNYGGLNRFNRQSGTFTSYYDQLPGFQCASAIAGDNKNGLWVGTYFGGVFSFDAQTNVSKKYTEKNGLLYDGALGIVEDNHDNLWLAAERGISIFNLETKRVRKLTSANGLPSESLINAFKTSTGRFLFATNEGGFISVNPDDFRPDLHPPVANIESVDFATSGGGKLKDSTLYPFGKDSISLKYNENRLTFHYVGIYYQNPQLNQYAYKLDGYDKDWIAAGTQKAVTYTNLSYGNYTFHVKASNSDGIWGQQGDSFSFTILPPWWQTWWAYALYVILLAAAVWAFAAYRSKNLRRANQLLEEKVEQRTSELNKSILDLKATQTQLIHSEKMASLGELTAGIAHEIQNPLNFMNNFSEVNVELIDEMREELKSGKITDADAIAENIRDNELKINHHGKRADAIVKGMLQHSRSTTGQKEFVLLNAIAEECLRLSYHGMRSKDNSFQAKLQTHFDNTIDEVPLIQQDMVRVFVNLFNNAFYAVHEKSKAQIPGYEPAVSVSTKRIGDRIEINVRDNGNGIPQKLIDKIFQPFFTTKPTGQGTGLGLSLSYDIVKAHGGEIKVDAQEGEPTEFVIQLPIVS
jgi:ligand-binding sensor domain-containing protein/signal transduction histidine kinase